MRCDWAARDSNVIVYGACGPRLIEDWDSIIRGGRSCGWTLRNFSF